MPNSSVKKLQTFYSDIIEANGVVVVGGYNRNQRQNCLMTLTRSLVLKNSLTINTNRKIDHTETKDFIQQIVAFSYKRATFLMVMLSEEHFHFLALAKFRPILIQANYQIKGGRRLSSKNSTTS